MIHLPAPVPPVALLSRVFFIYRFVDFSSSLFLMNEYIIHSGVFFPSLLRFLETGARVSSALQQQELPRVEHLLTTSRETQSGGCCSLSVRKDRYLCPCFSLVVAAAVATGGVSVTIGELQFWGTVEPGRFDNSPEKFFQSTIDLVGPDYDFHNLQLWLRLQQQFVYKDVEKTPPISDSDWSSTI